MVPIAVVAFTSDLLSVTHEFFYMYVLYSTSSGEFHPKHALFFHAKFRTGHRPTLSSIVANTAPPPTVGMRIVDQLGQDANAVGLGDELTLVIEIRDPESAFAIFARNLYARSSTGESLFLIDDRGCPVDATVFPALEPEFNNNKVLRSTFKAFRFPASGVVNFEVQIRFCQERCEPVRCHNSKDSYGRRRRRSVSTTDSDVERNA